MDEDPKSVLSLERADEIADTVRKWLDTPEGKRAVRHGLERARGLAAQFSEAQRVDPDVLKEPVTL
jgi:hypothetical protein